MKVLIKYHQKTEAKNLLFTLDTKIHYQCKTLKDNIDYYSGKVPVQSEPLEYSSSVDLTKYNGIQFYGIFDTYSRIDGNSMFIIDVGIDEIRDTKLNQLFN